jgi:hypothetical protein
MIKGQKTSVSCMIFAGQERGTANRLVGNIIFSSVTFEFIADIISALDFRLPKTRVKMNLQLYEIKISVIYDIQVKSYRAEESIYLSD